MPLLQLLEGLISFVFFITVITQVIIPLWRDLPLFPLFNKPRIIIERGLKNVHELEERQDMTDELQKRTNKILKHNGMKLK